MDLKELSELAQLQAKFAPLVEMINKTYPPEMRAYMQKMSESPIYKAITNLPVQQLNNAAKITEAEQQAMSVVNAFLANFEKLTPTEQKSIIDYAASVEIPTEVLEQVVNEPTAQEKHVVFADINCSVCAVPENIKILLMSFRETLYSIVHDSNKVQILIELCALLIAACNANLPMWAYACSICIVVISVLNVFSKSENNSND